MNDGPGRLSIIIPTFNEADNMGLLLPRLMEALDEGAVDFEVIVADDASPDGTADRAEAVLGDRGRALRRTGERGLAPAVIDGFAAAGSDVLCVMDADLSHPPEKVPELARAVFQGADLAVGSRYVPGGGIAGWPLKRRVISRVACLMAAPVTRVRDATSGFFCFRRSILDGVNLAVEGYKIGLEIFVKARARRIVEVPFVFSDRVAGQSKLGSKVIVQYLQHLLKLLVFRYHL